MAFDDSKTTPVGVTHESNSNSSDFSDTKNDKAEFPSADSYEKEQEHGGRKPKQISEAFDTTEDPRYYRPIDTYEGLHRWDPDFEWEEEEEKKIVRKVSSPSFCVPFH